MELHRRTFLASLAALVACRPTTSDAMPESDTDTDTDADTDADTDQDTDVDGTCASTKSDIEGPFYVDGVPVRSDLDLHGDDGEPLKLSGTLTGTDCAPIEGATVEIWHARPDGSYDNTNTHEYRGQQVTNADGTYAFNTLVPGRYLNGNQYRPAHVHLKVWVNGTNVLTTQIYFEGDPFLDVDPWAVPALTIPLDDEGRGIFDIVV